MKTTRVLPLVAAVVLAAACQGANPAASSAVLPPARFDAASTAGTDGATSAVTLSGDESCPSTGQTGTSTDPAQPTGGGASTCRGVNMLGSGN